MAKPYEVNQSTLRIARLTSWMARLGIGRTQVLTTTGRKTGQPRQLPVSPIEIEGVEHIVSPYGEVGWVRNVRANPEVTLRHGTKHRVARLHEITGVAAAVVVAAYHGREAYARRYMDVPDNPSLDDFVKAADRFPVFRVDSAQ
jgi:deazaflavin-dependent oxidoreductase (nitroreductase family)